MPAELISGRSTGRCRAINNIIDWPAFPAGGLLPFTSSPDYTTTCLPFPFTVTITLLFFNVLHFCFVPWNIFLVRRNRNEIQTNMYSSWRTNLIYNIYYNTPSTWCNPVTPTSGYIVEADPACVVMKQGVEHYLHIDYLILHIIIFAKCNYYCCGKDFRQTSESYDTMASLASSWTH